MFPRVTVFWSLGLLTLAAVVAAIFRQAILQGGVWVGFAMLFVFLGFWAVLSAGLYVVAFVIGQLGSLVEPKRIENSSPFAQDRLPPQLVPPTANEVE